MGKGKRMKGRKNKKIKRRRFDFGCKVGGTLFVDDIDSNIEKRGNREKINLYKK